MNRHYPVSVFVDTLQDCIGFIKPKMTAGGIQQESTELAASDKIQSGACKPSLVHPRPLGEQQRQGKDREDERDQEAAQEGAKQRQSISEDSRFFNIPSPLTIVVDMSTMPRRLRGFLDSFDLGGR